MITENYIVKDNVVTISTTDSQPSSIQLIEELKLDFNMQVLEDMEKEESSDDFKPKIIEAEIKVNPASPEHDDAMKVNGSNGTLSATESMSDLEINNNVSKTAIIHDDTQEIMMSSQTMNKFLSEIVFKGNDDSAIEDMATSEENATLTSSTVSDSSSESSSSTNVAMKKPSTTTKKTKTVPQSTANFIKNERKQTERNFVPQNQDIKFTTSYDNHRPSRDTQKRSSQIDQIRQNFEKSENSSAPVPVARKSSIPLPAQKNGTPSKIPVFKTNSSSSTPSKISPKSRTSSASRLNNPDSVG